MVAGGVVVVLGAVLLGFALGRSGDDEPVATDTSADTAGEEETTTTSGADDGPDGTEPDDTDDTGPDTSVAPPPVVDTAGLEGDALDLAEAINRAAGLEYHARYEGTQTNAEGTTEIAVELWRRLPNARRDTTITGSQVLRTLEFRRPDGLFGCIGAPPDVDLSCFVAPPGSVDPSDPVLGAVDPRGGLVIARAGEFEGQPVDCWEVESIDDATTTLCVDSVGIPVVIDDGSGRLLRTLLDDAIDASTFEVPAPIEEEEADN